NYQSYNAGIFITEKYSYKKWDFEGGVRFDYKSIYNTTDNENKFSYPDLNFNNLSGNIGTQYRLNSSTRLLINTSTAWRAPQVNELYANGLHHGASRLERGNQNLQAERSMSIGAGMIFNQSWLELDVNTYFKNINGFIFLQPDFPPELTIRGAFPVFSYNQTDARLHGADMNAVIHVDKHIDITLQGSVLRAWDLKLNDWIIQMPADRIEFQTTYHFSNAGKIFDTYISAGASYVSRQIRVPATGNIELPNTDPVVKQSDYLMPPSAYWLAKLEAGTKFRWAHQNCNLILSVTNLFDHAYRDYMNAFRYFSDEMGRNISLRLHIPFVIFHQHK
ncbi:MAG: TonB-dependent receptor domain-containing protein, partial [Bacteroidota bacterium]